MGKERLTSDSNPPGKCQPGDRITRMRRCLRQCISSVRQTFPQIFAVLPPKFIRNFKNPQEFIHFPAELTSLIVWPDCRFHQPERASDPFSMKKPGKNTLAFDVLSDAVHQRTLRTSLNRQSLRLARTALASSQARPFRQPVLRPVNCRSATW